MFSLRCPASGWSVIKMQSSNDNAALQPLPVLYLIVSLLSSRSNKKILLKRSVSLFYSCSNLAFFHQYLWVQQCDDTFFFTINEFAHLEANTHQYSTHHTEKRSSQNKYDNSAHYEPPHCVQKNPSCQSRHMFGRLYYSSPTLVAWSRFNNSWGLTDSKTYKRMW